MPLFSMKELFAGAAVALLAVAPASRARAIDTEEVPPAFSLHTADGRTVTLSDFRGKVVYLDFWASWCGPCKHTLPWMQSMERQFEKDGFEVVAINLDSDPKAAAALLKDVHPTFTVLYDPSGETAEQFEIPAMPTSMLIGRDGRVTSIHSGFSDDDQATLERQIADAVATDFNRSRPHSERARLGDDL